MCAGKAKWPEVSWDASDKQWVAQSRALNCYYSWPATAADEAACGTRSGEGAGESAGAKARAEMHTESGQREIRIRFPGGRGWAIVLSIGSIDCIPIRAGIMFAVIGLLLLGFSWWVTKQL